MSTVIGPTSFSAARPLRAGPRLSGHLAARGIREDIDEAAASSPSERHRSKASPKACQNTSKAVDRELHARARAYGPDVFHAAAQLFEQGPCARDIRRLTADEAKKLSVFRRSD